jgi:glycosyltransferase involved in cell wall biosynthesis
MRLGKRRRLLLLTQYFPPETGAPQARLFELASHLAAIGWDVRVLTALPSYPTGRIFDGYRDRLIVREEVAGVGVIRTPIYPTRSTRALPRMANYLSFVVSSSLCGLAGRDRPDVLLCESPPLFLGITALLISRRFRIPLIFNVSDLWPDSAVDLGMFRGDSKAVQLARRLEQACYQGAWAVSGQSPGIVRKLLERHPRHRAVLVPNGCDCTTFRPGLKDPEFIARHNLEGQFVIGYAGLLGVAQGVDAVLDVAELLIDDDRLRFVIVGDGPERVALERALIQRSLPNVILAGHLERARMPGVVGAFDVAFVPLRRKIEGALPSKIYEAMATSVPVLLAAHGDSRTVIKRSEAGLIVEYEPAAIAAAVQRLVNDPILARRLGDNGRRYVLEHHDRPAIAAVVDTLLRAAIDDDPSMFHNAVAVDASR